MLIAMLAVAWAGRKQTHANTNNAYYKRGANKAKSVLAGLKRVWRDKFKAHTGADTSGGGA